MALVHALLAALLREPCSGYDLAGRFDGSVGFFWKATHQQIYRELSSMEAEGLLSVDVMPQSGKPDRKVYSVTAAGQQTLTRWIQTPCPPSTYKEELLVKLFAGPLAGVGAAVTEVHTHRALHLDRLAEYRSIEARFFGGSLDIGARWQYLTLRCGIRIEEAWVAWCDEALQDLRRDQDGDLSAAI